MSSGRRDVSRMLAGAAGSILELHGCVQTAADGLNPQSEKYNVHLPHGLIRALKQSNAEFCPSEHCENQGMTA